PFTEATRRPTKAMAARKARMTAGGQAIERPIIDTTRPARGTAATAWGDSVLITDRPAGSHSPRRHWIDAMRPADPSMMSRIAIVMIPQSYPFGSDLTPDPSGRNGVDRVSCCHVFDGKGGIRTTERPP